jgi:hypothetical protein
VLGAVHRESGRGQESADIPHGHHVRICYHR